MSWPRRAPASTSLIGTAARAELGWSEIETEYPIAACELLFRAQGRALLNSDCLSKVMLAELAPVLDGAVDGIVLPGVGYAPGSEC